MDYVLALSENDEEVALFDYIIESDYQVQHYIDNTGEKFDFDKLDDDYCWIHFRFYKNDIKKLGELLNVPHSIVLPSRIKLSGVEALCILLKRLAYPNRYGDIMSIFPRSNSALSQIFNFMIKHVLQTKGNLLTDVNQPWLSIACIRRLSQTLVAKGSPYKHCFGFLDGTVRGICRPTYNQREYYNGHKRTHALKFQSLMLPNGIIANLYGPIKGRRHDAHILAKSKLIPKLEQKFAGIQNPPYIYGDPAYPLRPNLMVPFKGCVDRRKRVLNKKMSKVREAVEWGFGKIITLFAFLDFKRNLQIYKQNVADFYKVGTILTNCHTCLYGSQVCDYFDCSPPTLEEYLAYY